MEQFKEFIVKIYSGKLDRMEFLGRSVALIIGVVLAIGLSGLIFNPIIFLAPLMAIPITLFAAIYGFSLEVRRTRDILDPLDDTQVYSVAGLSYVLGLVIPFVVFIRILYLLFLPSKYSHSEFYKGNLEAPIENITEFFRSFFKKHSGPSKANEKLEDNRGE